MKKVKPFPMGLVTKALPVADGITDEELAVGQVAAATAISERRLDVHAMSVSMKLNDPDDGDDPIHYPPGASLFSLSMRSSGWAQVTKSSAVELSTPPVVLIALG